MVKNVINNVFILTHGLEKVIDKITFNDSLIRCYAVNLGSISSLKPENIDRTKEHNLLIVHYSSFTAEIKKEISDYFSKSFNFSSPYILYMTDKKLIENEKEIIYRNEGYIYNLPSSCDADYKDNFIFFIKAIFDRLHYIGRINSYIIDSFQTIINAQIIEDQRDQIVLLNNELQKLSKTDYLTNVLNRRAFFDVLESERKRTIRDHWRLHNLEAGGSSEIVTPDSVRKIHKPKGCFFEHYGNFSCIIIDIDHFKDINDTYGHLKGDEVLRKLGEVLTQSLIFRENDTVARYGGEEFVIVLPETNTYHAKIPAERLRKHIKSLQFSSDDGTPFRITISLGISEFKVTDTTNEEIINRADQALYYAKENGRDQVAIYEEIMEK